jgi:tRNA A-37 threonylcarbamoyl transferase component Bud32
MIGTQIGSYRIEQLIGEGGMGTVYRGVEVNLDRPVAIKVLNTDLARQPEIVERFRAEARAQANLNHPNIATLYAFLTYENTALIVMELVDGENFQAMVERRGPIPTNDTVPLFKQALLGIGAAHRVGIIHRDIKPSNLMLNKAGMVKVMDFGIAKAIAERGMTRTGVQVGTVFYMSPEQVKGQRVDIRSDIYALGVTLFEMLTSRVPFAADSDFQVLSDHVNTPPPLPTRFYPYIEKGYENIVLKALEKHPDDRFQSVEEFGAALEHPEKWESYQSKHAIAAPAAVVAAVAGMAPAANTVIQAPTVIAPPGAAVVNRKSLLTTQNKAIAAGVAALLLIGGAFAAFHHPKPKTPPNPCCAGPSGGGPSSGSTMMTPPPPAPIAIEQPPAAPAPAPTAPASNPTATGTVKPPVKQKPVAHVDKREVAAADIPTRSVEPPPAPKATLVTIPAQTVVVVRLIGGIDSSEVRPDQSFDATVDTPIYADGRVVVSKGADARVRVVNASKAGRLAGSAKLVLALSDITVGGRRYNVQSETTEFSGNGRGGRTGKAAAVGGVIGGIFGGITRGAKGAAIGAGIGAGGGAGAAAATGNTGVKVEAETRMQFSLSDPITITLR